MYHQVLYPVVRYKLPVRTRHHKYGVCMIYKRMSTQREDAMCTRAVYESSVQGEGTTTMTESES
jgi:hypothetical protein